MGLIVAARCARCGFERDELRLGATMGQMSGERRSALHLYRCEACHDLAQIELGLGEVPGTPPCDRCAAPLPIVRERAYRIVGMNETKLEGHLCPRCGEAALAFRETGRFL